MKEITKPTLLLDEQICRRNIERMAGKASEAGIRLRPHFKTHQSATIGNWFRDYGVDRITVSSVDMAFYFAEAGWDDILIAFPFQPLEAKRLNDLTEKARIAILADHPDALTSLGKLSGEVSVYIDISTGYGRTGIEADDFASIEEILSILDGMEKVHFSGFYCHAGHSYKAASRKEKDGIHQKALDDLGRLKERYIDRSPMVLYGDTPNSSIQEDFGGIDEITAGNYVFYDLTQVALGSCAEEDIAVAVACPVAAIYVDQGSLLIHGGAVHFSKDQLRLNDQVIFGKTVKMGQHGWMSEENPLYLSAISQEHGTIPATGSALKQFKRGDLVTLLPVHSCLTANMYDTYLSLNGEILPRL